LLWIKLILIWLTPFIHYCIKFKWSCLRCILIFSITWFINIRYLFLNNWNRSRIIFIVRINQLSKYHPIRSYAKLNYIRLIFLRFQSLWIKTIFFICYQCNLDMFIRKLAYFL
jgi:hypothetical protein